MRRRVLASMVVAASLGLMLGCSPRDAETVPGSPADPAPPGSSDAPSAGSPSPIAPTVAPTAGLAWSEEFDGAEGEALDASRWSISDRGDGYGNDEKQVYTPRPENVFQDGDGILHLIARKEQATDPRGFRGDFTSGRIETVERFQYGRVEARIKVPAGAGLWSAFWLFGASLQGEQWPAVGEIDVLEIIGNALDLHSTIIGARTDGERWSKGDYTYTGTAWSEDWHVYAVEWDADRLAFSVDGVPTFSYTPADLTAEEVWPFDRPYSITLNLAVGGSWGDPPDASTPFPSEMLVDYVRVYDSTVSGR